MSDIWFRRPDCAALNQLHEATACAALGIEIVAVGDDFLRGTMPVDERTLQPYGLLHGGASLALAETLGSAAAMAVIDSERFLSVGSAISANHLRAATEGRVTGTARAAYLGRTSHLWEIDIVDDRERMICLARLTTNVVARRPTG